MIIKTMLKKILKNLQKPHLIPRKIFSKILNQYYFNKYDFKKFLEDQNNLFLKLELNREEGEKKLQKIKEEFKFLESPMASEHQVLFSSLSLKKKIPEILEIGTFDGKNSVLLSKLFPDSNISTIDLDNTDENFRLSYNRNDSEEFNKFCDSRDKILSLANNVTFKKTNSVHLTSTNKKYDLIWVDGAHGYPVVTIDIINSVKLLNHDGIILCDDVILSKPSQQDSMYESIASHETLKILKNSGVIDYELLFKRLDSTNNSNPFSRKFIACVKIK